jgi:glutamate-1-semialdehyde 2,1-aminomutase
MGAMNEFLRRLDDPVIQRAYEAGDAVWKARATSLNTRLEALGMPVRVANLMSIWTVCYTVPSRYNWMFQYYLRAEGLALSWVGSGRLVFSHDYSDADFAAVADRFIAAARAMHADGWWWHRPGAANTTINRQAALELVDALARDVAGRLMPSGRRRSDRTDHRAAGAAAPGSTAAHRETGR